MLLRNLVDNALRYTPPGGMVTVEVDTPADRPDIARLRVIDNGPGVPPASRDEVFLRFFRLPGSDHTGSGLGLSIVKEIVLGHHGEIRLLDGQAAGSGRPGLTVEIRLPLRAAASA